MLLNNGHKLLLDLLNFPSVFAYNFFTFTLVNSHRGWSIPILNVNTAKQHEKYCWNNVKSGSNPENMSPFVNRILYGNK